MQENKPPLTFKNTKKNICLERKREIFFDADPYPAVFDHDCSNNPTEDCSQQSAEGFMGWLLLQAAQGTDPFCLPPLGR